jgi:hypothetical protein
MHFFNLKPTGFATRGTTDNVIKAVKLHAF